MGVMRWADVTVGERCDCWPCCDAAKYAFCAAATRGRAVAISVEAPREFVGWRSCWRKRPAGSGVLPAEVRAAARGAGEAGG